MNGLSVTEVRVDLNCRRRGEPLQAYCQVVLFGCVVVREVKVITAGGSTFLSMPSRRRQDACRRQVNGRPCLGKNFASSSYCCRCGVRLPPFAERDFPVVGGSLRQYEDLVFPNCREAREAISRAVLDAFHAACSAEETPPAAAAAVVEAATAAA